MRAQDLATTFASWARSQPGLEPDVVDTLIEFKTDYLGDDHPGRWRSGDLSELLIEVIPRKLTADDAWYAAVVPTAQAFLRFAERKHALHPQSAPIQHLLQELTDIEIEFGHAVRDPAKFGLAKGLMQHMGLDAGADLSQESLNTAMEQFNALPFEERKAVTDGPIERARPEDPDPLPMIRLAPAEQLAAAARASSVLGDVRKLARWLGDGRKVTKTGVLTMAETRSLIDAFGVPELAESARDARSARDVPFIDQLWYLAVEAEVLDAGKTVARPGSRFDTAAADDAPDDAVLELWQHLFRAVVYEGWLEESYPLLGEQLGEAVLHALMSAYTGQAHGVLELVDEFTPAADDSDLAPVLHDYAVARLSGWAAMAVALGAVQPWPAVAPDVPLELTPLGVHGVRELMLEAGIGAPLAPDVAPLSAEALLTVMDDATPDVSSELATEWFSARPRDEAVAELIAVARAGSARARQAVVTVLNIVDENGVAAFEAELAAEPLLHLVVLATLHDRVALLEHARAFGIGDGRTWDDVLDELEDGDPALTPVAMIFLGLGWTTGDFTPAERALLAVESIALALDGLEPPIRVQHLTTPLWDLVDDATLPGLAASGHPDAAEVLDAVGSGHPVGRVRRAAKKAAYKLRRV